MNILILNVLLPIVRRRTKAKKIYSKQKKTVKKDGNNENENFCRLEQITLSLCGS